MEEQLLEVKSSSFVTYAGGDILAKETKSKKGIVGSQPRGSYNAFMHNPKDTNF